MSQVAALKQDTGQQQCNLPALVIGTRLNSIIDGIQDNLRTRRFMYVPQDQSPYWDNVQLFGDDFIIGFPRQAVREMTEAGNCLAAGRWTACVFHSMRVAEHGLRRLATSLRVTISSKGKNCPLEYGTWDAVIAAIRNKITETRKLPSGAVRERRLQYYSTAADHCEYMKDIWRNEVAHSRRCYNKQESVAVLSRVREFVQPLAKSEADKVVNKRVRAAKIKQSLRETTHLRNFASLLGKP
jgi:hypothetical protein